MIDKFNDVETRNSGIVYKSTLEQIKKLYAVDPEQAGELAIAAIELVLTGQISTDDVMIDMMLTTTKAINANNTQKYESRLEGARQKKIREMKLAEIAEFMMQGRRQKEIGERLGLSQQNVSYRVNLIRTQYPELLAQEEEDNRSTNENTNNLDDTNKITNENPVFCKNQDGVEEEEEPVVYQKGFKF